MYIIYPRDLYTFYIFHTINYTNILKIIQNINTFFCTSICILSMRDLTDRLNNEKD